MDDNIKNGPDWLRELKETRVTYEGRVLFGETIIEIVQDEEESE